MTAPIELAAWRDLCRRLESLGDQLLGGEYPQAPEDRVEGVAHLAQQVVCWLAWSVGAADPQRPAFQRQNDLSTQWGGPNADNVYRHARVDPAHSYRIRGRMHGCDEFILAVRAGFMHMERWGTLVETTASELGIGHGDDFELVLGGDEQTSSIPLPEGAVMVSIREYYFDWSADEPATFTIECLDPDEAAAPRRTATDLARQLDEAIAHTERSITYWNRYLRDARAQREDNSFAPPLRVAKGLASAHYAYCFFDLAPEEALLVDTDLPVARYWSLQLYTHGWFELVDPANRTSTLNHEQVAIDGDGRLRVVVAHDDPGVPNWLDTGGRRSGLVMLRWFWPEREPSPSAVVVPVAAVADQLPAGTVPVSPQARRDAVAARRRHLAWRFRT